MTNVDRTCTLVDELLYAEVISRTIVVMRGLQFALTSLVTSLDRLDANEEQRLAESLCKLNSESIREALHKSELQITNTIIALKNDILMQLEVARPDGHEIINAADYPNYSW